MKKFVASSVVVGLLFVFSWIDFLPVRCEVCEQVVFRTDLTSTLFGGHGTVLHQNCLDIYANKPPLEFLVARPRPLILEVPEIPAPIAPNPAS